MHIHSERKRTCSLSPSQKLLIKNASSCVLDDVQDVDTTKFEYAVKTILKYFRKHGKDAPGRYQDFIQNIIIGGSELKQSILDFFVQRNGC